MEKRIWVLGSKHPNAHKSISWGSTFPHFANCDIIIVNLQSLKLDQLQKRSEEIYKKARRYIFDLLMTGEKEVFIILSSEKSLSTWLPIFPTLKETPRVEIGEYTAKSPIDKYLKKVEACPFYIHDFKAHYCVEKTDPDSREHENYPFTREASIYEDGYHGAIYVDRRIMNKARQVIGADVKFIIDYGYNREKQFVSGSLCFLPPPTSCTAEQAIDIMVNILTGGELMESPPTWENKIDLPELKEVKRQIARKEGERAKLIKDIDKLRDKEDKLIKFRRLLWTKGNPLDNIVKEAFNFLGFSDIRKIREENLEDWVINFKLASQYQYGVFEIKGADQRTSLSDLTQCNKWAEDYMVENRGYAKGIFVPNQYRLVDIRKNKKKREHFEDNELKYAGSREICILPSHEIFYAVVEKMKGNPQITRKFIEEKIATSYGICKLSEAL